MKGLKFDSIERLERYKATGELPDIHNNIARLAHDVPIKECTCIDLGCCYGLLSKRLLKEGYKKVIGIDGSKAYISERLKDRNISYENFYVNRRTEKYLESIIRMENVRVIVARRIFPEIADTEDVDFVRALSKLFARCGVHYIVIEGRAVTKRASNPLSDVDKEYECFKGEYECIDDTVKNCKLLRAYEMV